MKIVEDLIQGSEEWHAFRKSRIGASDSAAILGVSKWSTAMQLWERKLGIANEQSVNFAMSRGVDLEDEARNAFTKLKNIVTIPTVVQHETLDWCIASLDGLSLCYKYALEIKVPGREAHLSALAGVVPSYYIPQLQHQLAVTGLDMIYYYSYDGQNNACIEVYRDQEYIDELIEEELKFYKCMVTCTPPELTERDYNIRTDDEWKYAVIDWCKANQLYQEWKEELERSREVLTRLSQSRNSKGFGVKVQKIMRQGAVQYSEIECLKEVDLDKYRKPASESWRITLDE